LSGPAFTGALQDNLAAIPPAEWDACANPPGQVFNPFLSHGFLYALEQSGCVGKGTGWGPAHLMVRDGNGALVGVAPQYVKYHSQGEYIFDHSWADAFERVGGAYYPKLLIAVPFTPATGPRLLVKPGADASAARLALVRAGIAAARQLSVSSLHINFLSDADRVGLEAEGFLHREDRQFHWYNEGYRDFQDFLDSLSSRKRKQIRKERDIARGGGIEIEALSGAALREEHWDAFFDFYMDTSGRKWGRPYLNRAFFSRLGEAMADHVVLVLARRGGRWIAGALNLRGSDALFGRNWGCIEDHPCLHFEVCYYQAIDFAISAKLARVEAGAQGEHKLARGYRPTITHSMHWIAEPGFRDAVSRYLIAERRAVEAQVEMLDAHLPFRHVPAPEEEV
jgi:predicted N-acyltransferase